MATRHGIRKMRVTRDLIEKCCIDFRGVQSKSEWPEAHAVLFQKICDADRKWYSDFLHSSEPLPTEKEALRRTIDQVVRAANSCRQDLDIESTWRTRIEKYIIGRFERETNCKQCSRSPLGSESRYLPENAFESHEYKGRPRIRRKCHCEPSTNYEDIRESGEVNIFNIKTGSKILCFDHENLKSEEIGERAPDCLIGLATTTSMKQCLEARSNLKYYPFINLDHKLLVFPFLVIEAKSEKGSPGFASIEAQTAFPIMAMLQRLGQLEEDVEKPIDPLVWFFAYAGCDIRLYGCAKTRAGFEIFELWHGSICYHDKVFRLFYILDILCDWAREFRRKVQLRLVPDYQQLRVWTPASTEVSSQDIMRSASVFTDVPAILSDADEQLLGLHISGDVDWSVDSAMELSESHSEKESDEEPILQTSIEHETWFCNPSGQRHFVIVRHIDTVKYQFRHYMVPNMDNLSFPSNEANRFLQVVRYAMMERSFLPISNETMKALATAWLDTSPGKVASHIEDGKLCLIKLDTFFDPEDLLPVRSLTCISLSVALVRSAVSSSGKDHPVPIPIPEVDQSSISEADRLIQSFIAIGRSLCRKDSLHSCLLGLEYHLVPGWQFPFQDHRHCLNLSGDPSGVKHTLFKLVENDSATRLFQRSVIRLRYPGQQGTQIPAPKTFCRRENIVIGRIGPVSITRPELAVLVASEEIFNHDFIKKKLPRLLRNALTNKDAYRAKDATDEVRDLRLDVEHTVETCSETFELATKFYEHLKSASQFEASSIEPIMVE